MTHAIQQPDLDYITDYFAKRHSRGHAPSAVWGVFDRGGLVATGTTGTLPDGTTPTEHTAYRVASCTKSFVAAGVLALRDAGELDLDDPITRYVPAFTEVVLPTADSPVPTLRILLTMSAGFPTDNPWGDRQESMTNDELDAFLRRGLTFDTVPGTTFAYSNLGFALVGRAIEAVTGTTFIDFVTERFIRPLGLTGTGFDTSVPAAGGVAVGTRWLDDHWEPLPFSGPGAFSPIGGMFSTVTDLSRWAHWMSEAFDDEGADAPGSPLSRASRRELQQVQRFVAEPGRPGGYGFGLHTNHYPGGDVITCHSGGYPGFSAHMRWSQTSGVGMVAFENATGSRVPVAVIEVLDHLVSTRKPKPIDRLLPAVRVAQQAATGLIREWSDEAADRLFSENVALDDPYDRRRKSIAKAVERIGGLDASAAPRPQDEESNSPSHLVWFIPGHAGRLRAELQLTPENPPRVQFLQVTVDKG
ncbi:serine hydrolase domain-containing protein [Homoserinimonas sp. A447]